MSTIEEKRRLLLDRAVHCRQLADIFREPNTKEHFLRAAHGWEWLASLKNQNRIGV